MLEGKGLTVHSHGYQGLPSIKRRLHRKTNREIVDRAANKLLGVVLHAGPIENLG